MTFSKILKYNFCHAPDSGRFCSSGATFKKAKGLYEVSFGGTRLGTLRKGSLVGTHRSDRGDYGWVAELTISGERVAFEEYDFSSAKARVNEELYRRRPKSSRPQFSPEDIGDD